MLEFTQVDIQQQTEEWYSYRNLGIGASDSSVLLGLNKYQTIQDLYLKKTGQIPSHQEDSEATAHGSRNEDLVRDLINVETGSNFVPACVINNKYPFIRASLDGLENNRILEIKCPFNKYMFFNQRKKIPSYYYCQVQHQLLTTGFEIAYFTVWFEYKKYTFKVLRDEEFITELERRIIKFWKSVQDKIEPNYDEYAKYE
jgi:putative phage-type endonuclease